MNVQWKNLLARTALWLVAEILLSCLGLDELADCSEFVFEQKVRIIGYVELFFAKPC